MTQSSDIQRHRSTIMHNGPRAAQEIIILLGSLYPFASYYLQAKLRRRFAGRYYSKVYMDVRVCVVYERMCTRT